MRRFYEGNDNKGYQEVVDKEAGLASQQLFMFQEILSMKLQQPEA